MKLLVLFLTLSIPSLSQSFTLNNSVAAAFSKETVRVNVASHTCNNLGITNSELLSLANEAVNVFWNRVPTSHLQMSSGSIVNVTDSFRTDGVCTDNGIECTPNPNLIVSSDILISCNDDSGGAGTNFSSSSVVAITVNNNISGTTINGSLILINDTPSNTFQTLEHSQKLAIIAHEIGHAIGLGHSPVEDSLMYFTTVPNRSRLGEDDMDGVTYLYPAQQPFNSCGTISIKNNTPLFPVVVLCVLLSIGLTRLLLNRRLNT